MSPPLKVIGILALLFIGLVAMAAALGCAFITFATNDYRPIIASGIGFALLALLCFGVLLWWQRTEMAVRMIVFVVGVLPTLLALAELVRRTLNSLLG